MSEGNMVYNKAIVKTDIILYNCSSNIDCQAATLKNCWKQYDDKCYYLKKKLNKKSILYKNFHYYDDIGDFIRNGAQINC